MMTSDFHSPNQYDSNKSFQNTYFPATTAKHSGFITKVGLTPRATVSIPSSQPENNDATSMDLVSIIHGNNEELASILRILKSTFPDLLNEALLMVEDERSRRIQLEAQLDVVKEQWKADIARQNEIITQKTDIISRMSRRSIDTLGDRSTTDLLRQLQEAQAEIENLRDVIRTIK